MPKRDTGPADPSPDEVREALERIVTSEVFRSSPQLASFLNFVVEATLSGKSERIKGYTIGVEVLQRGADFDPQIDPIVRVEATRLRRALERYYAGPGATDPLIIELPRGSYVPALSYRAVGDASTAEDAEFRPGNGMPRLLVWPLETAGDEMQTRAAELFHKKICDALAHFDTVNVATAPTKDGADPPADYELSGSIETCGDAVSVRFRLFDTAARRVAWSRGFDEVSAAGGRAAAEDAIITELAAVLLQPFGVIRSNEWVRHLSTGKGDPRYRAIVQASESFRSFDAAQHWNARNELERLTAKDPAFATGFAYLAALYLRDYQYGYSAEQNDAALLDRGLALARRAIELVPESSRAYQMLFGVLFARREIAAAFAAGDKAMQLNPYDMTIVGDYGGRLLIVGEIERGMQMLRRAVQFGTVRPSWYHFYMFLGAYLTDDLIEMIYHSNQSTNDNFPLGLIARALAGLKAGEPERADAALSQLATLRPTWVSNLRRALDRFFPVPALADRIARDLAGTGLIAA